MRESPPDPSEEGKAAIAERKRLRTEARQLVAEFRQRRAHIHWVIDSIQRQHRPDYHQALQEAILALHGCRTVHLASFAVRKVAVELIVWEGTVEEFRLIGHPEAAACYAWHSQKAGRREYFSLLKSPLVDSPQRAVQLALAAPGWRLDKLAGKDGAYRV